MRCAVCILTFLRADLEIEARQKAVENALEKANLYAKEADRQASDVLMIGELGTWQGFTMLASAASMARIKIQ